MPGFLNLEGPLAHRPGSDEAIEAVHLVNGDRQEAYGSPAVNWLGIAHVWSGLLIRKLKKPITAEEAALMMSGMKIQRQFMKPKRDNMVDAHGYIVVAAHCRGPEETDECPNPTSSKPTTPLTPQSNKILRRLLMGASKISSVKTSRRWVRSKSRRTFKRGRK